MSRTEIRSWQIRDGTLGRADLDVVTPGSAVVAKIVAGTGITLSQTGADTGTGDVTVSAPPTSPLAHHATHEPGGSDALVALSADILTSGTLPDARLTINVLKHTGGYPGGTANFLRADGTFAAPPTGGIPGPHHATHEPGGADALVGAAWLAQANVFTQGQSAPSLEVTTGTLLFNKAVNPVNNRFWQILEQQEATGPLTVVANADDFSAQAVFYFLRDGNFYAPGGLNVTPLNASNLTSGTVPDARLSANVQMKPIAAADLPAHATRHQPGGADAMAVDAAAATGSLRTLGTTATSACAGNDTRLSNARTPTAHATTHKSGGTDLIALDTLGAPTDILTLNASATAHGLLPKLSNVATQFLTGTGTWAVPTGTTPAAHAATHQPGGSDPMVVDAAAATGSLRTLGTTATSACAGDDSRLTNARTPTAHASTHQPGGSDVMVVDAAATVGSLRTIGTGALQAAAGNDSRFTDARTPTAHKTTHQTGGSDVVDVTLLGGFPGGTTNFLRADGTFAAPPGGGFTLPLTQDMWIQKTYPRVLFDWPGTTAKARVLNAVAGEWLGLTLNANYDAGVWSQDDATKDSFYCTISAAEGFNVYYMAAGVPGTHNQLLYVNKTQIILNKNTSVNGTLITGRVIEEVGAGPFLALRDTAQPSGSQAWIWHNTGQQMQLRAWNDDYTVAGAIAIVAERNGNVTLSNNASVAGNLFVTGRADLNGSVYIANGYPLIDINDTTQTTNNKYWRILNSSTLLQFATLTDGGASYINTPLILYRDGGMQIGGSFILNGNITYTTVCNIKSNTSDGSDTGLLLLTGGGSSGVERGAQIQMFGNENASFPGQMYFDAISSMFWRGDGYTTRMSLSASQLIVSATSGIFSLGQVYPGRVDASGTQTSWYLGSHSSYGLYSNTGLYLAYHLWCQQVQATGHHYFLGDYYLLRNVDNGYITICGGSNALGANGAFFALAGVTNAVGGVDAGGMKFQLGNVGGAAWKFFHGNNTLIWRIDQLGEMQQYCYGSRHAIWNAADSSYAYMEFQRAGGSYGYVGNSGYLGGGGASAADDFCVRGVNRLVLASDYGQIVAMPVYNTGNAIGSNVYADSNGILSRFTSSRRYKTAVTTYDSDAALRLRPVTFTSLLPRDSGHRGLGFIAEEVAAVDPRFALYDQAGEPDGLSQTAIMAAMLATIQSLQTRIADLEARHADE